MRKNSSIEITVILFQQIYNPPHTHTHTPTHTHTTDALLAVTVDGVAKHWLLPSRHDMKEQEQLFEEKAQNLDVNHPLSVASSCHKTHCTVLIVTQKAWVVGGQSLYNYVDQCFQTILLNLVLVAKLDRPLLASGTLHFLKAYIELSNC